MEWVWITAALGAEPLLTDVVAAPHMVIDEKAASACTLLPKGALSGKATLRGLPAASLPPARLWDLSVPTEREAYFALCQKMVGSDCLASELLSLEAATCLVGAAHFVGAVTPPAQGAPILMGASDGSLLWIQDYREPGECWTPASIQVEARTGRLSGEPPLHPVCR